LSRENAVLEDYAFLADGLIALYSATGESHWLGVARGLADRMLSHFEGPPGTGFFKTASSSAADSLFVRPRVLMDNVIPSGNTVALRVLLQLSSITKDPRYEAAAERTMTAFGPMFERSPAFVGTAITALLNDRPGGGKPLVRETSGTSLPSLPTGKDYVRSRVERSETEPHRARVHVDISDGWHLNANPASLSFLIPTTVELVVPGQGDRPLGPKPRLVAILYPRGVDYAPRFSLEPLVVYEGDIEIPVDLPQPLPPNAALALTFQACDASTCLRPETLELEIP
jgi:hypothetical protein